MSQAEVIGTVLMILVFAGLGGIAWVIQRNRSKGRNTSV